MVTFFTELMRRDGVLHVLNERPPNPAMVSCEELKKWREADRKGRPHIVLNLAEEPATLITLLLIFDDPTKTFGTEFATFINGKIFSRNSICKRDQNLQLAENGDSI